MGMVAASALSFTSCNKNEIKPAEVKSEGVAFELFATPAETKTANDGLSTKWVVDDQMNVFHAVAGTSTYVPDGAFAVSDVTTGRAAGTLGGALDETKTYDWYAIYPYSSYYTTVANTSGAYAYLGSRSDAAQIQTGNDSKAHLAGVGYPIWGKAEAVAAGTTPEITMNQVTSVVEFTVTNSLEEDLIITGIEFEATEDIVGSYYIDFSGETPSFTKQKTYQSSTAVLTVENGTAIAPASSAKFYVAIKPFTAAAEDELTVTVAGKTATGEGTQVKNITLTKETVFAPGKIKKVAVNYNTAVTPVAPSYSFNLAANTPVSASDTQLAWDSDYATMVFDKANASTATNNYYPGTSGKTYSHTRAYSGSKITIAPKAGYKINSIEFTATTETYATALKNSTFTNATASIDGTVVTAEVTVPENSVVISVGGTCGMTLVKVYYEVVPVLPSWEITEEIAVLDADDEDTHEVSVTTDATSVEVNAYTTDAYATECDWIAVSYESSKLVYLAEANTGSERVAYVRIKTSNDNGDKYYYTTITQAAAAGQENLVALFASENNSKGISAYSSSWSATNDGFTVNIVNFNNNNNGWSGVIKAGSKNTASVASISTAAAVDYAVSSVVVSFTAVTASSVNSIKLYMGDTADAITTEVGSYTVASGNQSVSVASPAANKFYKIEFDLQQGSGNGFVALNKVEYCR